MAKKPPPAKKPAAGKRAATKPAAPPPDAGFGSDPVVAPKSPAKYRARVRMYRHGLGDCFLVTFPRPDGKPPFQMLIDCGVLARDSQHMTRLAEHIRDTLRSDQPAGAPRLDVVVATHEHQDHLSGFNQARAVFDDLDFGAVWLGWTENLTQPQIKKIKEAKKKAGDKLKEAKKKAEEKLKRAGAPAAALAGTLDDLSALFSFSADDDGPGTRTIAEALEYLKVRGKAAGGPEYLEPGTGPLPLAGVDGVRVYVLGPPRDPILLKGSEVTEQLKKDGVVYHLAATGEAGTNALVAAFAAAAGVPEPDGDRYHPFAEEHRLTETIPNPLDHSRRPKPNPYFDLVRPFIGATYNAPGKEWRQIDHDWLTAFGQLALDLDSDTNNTSLVLAFEFVGTGEVLLFVGDAQVGNWRSWANLEFKVPDREKPVPAHDLIARTVFYKVGHHCSHNATLKKGGLELMTRDDLVAFIPLDRATAKAKGRKDEHGVPKGWDMPAPPLHKALLKRAGKRVVVSDANDPLPPEAKGAGVLATGTYIDYFLE